MFVEIGVREAVSLERSWFLAKGWRNIVVDVMPGTIDELRRLSGHRVYSLHSCVSLRRPSLSRFTEESYYTSKFEFSIEAILKHFRPHTYTYTPCFTLNTIFAAFGLRQIDFLSLDINGRELDVIDRVDFNRIRISLMRVRQSFYEKRRDLVIQKMVKKGYVFERQINADLYFKSTRFI